MILSPRATHFFAGFQTVVGGGGWRPGASLLYKRSKTVKAVSFSPKNSPPEFDTKRCKCLIYINLARELPRQEASLGVWVGVLDVQCGKRARLFARDGGDAAYRHALVDGHALALNAAQLGHAD